MIMKHKKLIITLIAALTGIALLINLLNTKKGVNPGIVDHFTLNSQMVTQLTDKNDLFAWLDKEEKAVWVELQKTLNLSLEQFEALKKEKLTVYNNSLESMINDYGSGEEVTHTTIDFIKSIMVEFGVNPDHMTILAWKLNSAASATDTLIFVNEEIFNKLSLIEKKYSIGHELIHVIKKDHSTRFLIEELHPAFVTDNQNMNNPLNKLSRFHEHRADILSCLKGIDYAQGNVSFFKEHIKLNGDQQHPSHPKSSLRLELGIKITGLLTNNSQQA